MVIFLVALVLVAGTASVASADELLAQPAGGTEDESESGTTSGEDESQTEEGAGGGEEPAETETGPPWTYQMARIALVLLLFLGLGVGLMYWRLIVSRQRGTA